MDLRASTPNAGESESDVAVQDMPTAVSKVHATRLTLEHGCHCPWQWVVDLLSPLILGPTEGKRGSRSQQASVVPGASISPPEMAC